MEARGNQEHHRHLVARIVARLSERPLESGTINGFVEQMVAADEPIADELNGMESATAEALIDLIFFPGPSLQVDLEPLLQRARFGPCEAERIAARLQRAAPRCRVQVSGRPAFQVTMPPWAAGHFVRRLRIDRQLPPLLAQALMQLKPEAAAGALAVRLRNCRRVPAGAVERLLNDYLVAFRAETPDFLPVFDFLLELADEWEGDVDPRARLVARRGEYLRQYELAGRQQRRLARGTMETLMMTGTRLLAIAPELLVQRVAWIERVLLTLFGVVVGNETTAPVAALRADGSAERLAHLTDLFHHE